MFSKTEFIFVFLFCLLFMCTLVQSADVPTETVTEPAKEEKVDEQKLEYAKGSVCGYCDYCKFCKLCDNDCPCETSPTKPNCKMCKYCKFCYLCKVCDTVCQPGGIIDTMSAALVNALPSHDPDEINKDIESVKTWIDKKKDEL